MENRENQVEFEKSAPNMLTNFEEAVNAIFEVEGAAYTIRTDDKEIIREQMYLALIHLQEYITKHPEKKEEPDTEGVRSLKEFSVSGFEGSGGFNRYGITRQGNIILSESHCFLDSQEKAKEIGFEVRKSI